MITLKNGLEIQIRSYKEADFSSIHALNEQENWSNLVEKKRIQKPLGIIRTSLMLQRLMIK